MKLLIASHAAVLGVNRALFQCLAAQTDWDVRMIVPQTWRGDLIRELRFAPVPGDAGIRIHPLPVLGGGNGSLFVYARDPHRVLRDWTPELVFVDEEPWSLAAAQLYRSFAGIPRVFYTKQNLRKRLPPPFSLLQKWIFRQSRDAFSVASEVSEVLRWKGFPGRIHELPHSYDPLGFAPAAAEIRRKRRRYWGIPENATVVAYFGRVTEEKGIEEFLAASRQLAATSGADLFFWIVGNGPLREQLVPWRSDLSPARSGVHDAIPHDRVGEALSAVDILVLPSRTTPRWKEQFGRILIEAMASNAAVIGSDSGEIPRLIQRTQGGLVFPEGDAVALAERIQYLATDSVALAKFRQQGRESAERSFSHAAVARLLENLLSQST